LEPFAQWSRLKPATDGNPSRLCKGGLKRYHNPNPGKKRRHPLPRRGTPRPLLQRLKGFSKESMVKTLDSDMLEKPRADTFLKRGNQLTEMKKSMAPRAHRKKKKLYDKKPKKPKGLVRIDDGGKGKAQIGVALRGPFSKGRGGILIERNYKKLSASVGEQEFPERKTDHIQEQAERCGRGEKDLTLIYRRIAERGNLRKGKLLKTWGIPFFNT